MAAGSKPSGEDDGEPAPGMGGCAGDPIEGIEGEVGTVEFIAK